MPQRGRPHIASTGAVLVVVVTLVAIATGQTGWHKGGGVDGSGCSSSSRNNCSWSWSERGNVGKVYDNS